LMTGEKRQCNSCHSISVAKKAMKQPSEHGETLTEKT
jgi:hypothetical protein